MTQAEIPSFPHLIVRIQVLIKLLFAYKHFHLLKYILKASKMRHANKKSETSVLAVTLLASQHSHPCIITSPLECGLTL